MTTLAEHIIVTGVENRPPMLEKSMYNSCASRIRLFIKGKKHGKLDLIDNGPLVYPTVEENGQTRPKKYSELTEAQQLQDDCDLYAYLIQLERHANEVRITRERYLDPLAFVSKSPTLYNPYQSPQHSGTLMYPPPQQFTPVYAAPIHPQHHHTPQGEDPIECINKAFPFLSAVASRFPPSNNQLRTSFNPRNQATIQDGRVTVQQVQGRQNQSYVGTGNRRLATTSKGNVAAGQPRVVKCYNCQGEGHVERQCTQPKRPRNVAWFKEKLMLSEAQEAGQILDEEQLVFLADPDCDDLSSAKAVLMANLSSCDPEVLSGVSYSDSYPNDLINQDVQEMQYSEQNDFEDNEIHYGRNIIMYSQYL
ncbi:integrase, catalytic region, zinc finger, CCHC-type containing protein [Tanacetum coccineum]